MDSSTKTTYHPILINFKNLICQDFSKMESIEDYAKRLNTSINQLSTICKSSVGITPKQLQLDLKITEAKRLLIYTSSNASEAAYQVGFEDTSYFSRIFKKKTELSPTAFKEKYLNNKEKS